jgi:hypothetical protein
MPVFKISTLTTATAVSATNQFEINQNGASRSATLAQVIALVSSGVGAPGTCQAWVNFNGTGTVSIRGSGNVSSITDVTTGGYRVIFTTAQPNANFSALGFASSDNASPLASLNIDGFAAAVSTTQVNIGIVNTAGTRVDREVIMFAVIR